MLVWPATELIGNLLAGLPAGGGITGPGTERVPARKEKSTLLRICGNERDMWSGCLRGVNSRQDQRRTGQEGSGVEYIVTFCHCGGGCIGISRRYGLAFEFSAIQRR